MVIGCSWSCILIVAPIDLWNTMVLLTAILPSGNSIPFSSDHLPSLCQNEATLIHSEWHSDVLPVDPDKEDHWVDISFTPGIQLDVIYKGVADGHETYESVSISTLCDDRAEGVKAHAEQQWGQWITLVYANLD